MSDETMVRRTFIRKSMLSGKTRTKTFEATDAQWKMMDNGALIQQALPHLTDGEREFIMTGVTDEEWDTAFPEDDEAGEGSSDRPDEPAF